MGVAHRPRVLVVDNYDSFTFNLVQYLTAAGAACKVVENDRATVAELQALNPDGLLISPGPGAPGDAGITLQLIRELGGSVPVLGVCLGHQAIAQAFGARVSRSGTPVDGTVSRKEKDILEV